MKQKPDLFILGLDGAVTSFILEEIEKGKLPNFAKFLEKGCLLTDTRPPYPTISATCWSTMQTGASPHVHGITDEVLLPKGEYPNKFSTAYHGDYLLAERFWEAAARKGKKSMIADFCMAGPAKSDLVRQIGMGCNTVDTSVKGQQNTVSEKDISEQLYLFDADMVDALPEKGRMEKAPSGKWQPSAKLKPSSYTKLDNGWFKLNVEKKNYLENPRGIEDFYWVMKYTDDGIYIAFDEDHMKENIHYHVPMNGWSKVINRELRDSTGEGKYKFRITAKRVSDGGFYIFITATVNLMTATSPHSFSKRINDIDEIPSSNNYGHFFLKEGNIDTAFELIGFKYEWFKEIIIDAIENDPVEIMAFVQGYTDTVNHMYRGVFERVEKATKAEYETAKDAYERAYEIADHFIGWLYDNVIGEDTVFVIISDHGAVGCNRTVLVHDYFEKEGMLAYIPPADGKNVYWRDRVIDWSKTKAFPVGCGSIYVNLKGREPEGIVEPEDYDKTVNDIIKVLHKHHWNEKDQCYLAFATHRSQAGFIGLGEDRIGDVVYGLSGNSTGGYIGGVHACQVPTAKTETGDIRCFFGISGKNIKAGQKIDRPANLEDVAPTLCYLLKYPQPKDATGAVLFHLFENDLYQD